jgi:hypothetical protein
MELPETISTRVLNRKAGDEREGLFQALETFANMGDGRGDPKLFLRMCPRFFPEVAYSGVGTWASGERTTKPMIYWYRDALRTLWRGHDTNGVYLNAMLGLEWDSVEIAKAWDDAIEGLGTIGLSRPRADWASGEIILEFSTDFQRALFALMKDSWRAKVCPECKRFFIASKTAQAYCSPTCYGEMKRKYSLRYWRRTGSATRAARRKKQK